MDKGELQLILKEGEGYKTEFKESLSNIDRELVAFANSSGGKILLGVTDEGAVKGISATNELKSRIQDIANNCRPKVRITLEVSHDVLIVTVLESEDKPCECSSGFYKRIGANSQKMTRNEIIDFFKSEGKVRFDELLETRCIYPKDFDRGKLSAFLVLAGLSRSLKAETILHSLDVTEKQEGKLRFNNAGVLFFAKEPQRFISWSVFTVVLFKDKNGVDVIDRKELSGSLFEIVDSVMDFVRLYAKVAYRFTGKPQREEIYEYPFEAIREAVINSVMHKDYFERGHNNILKFFPDRIQLENIWMKPRHFILGKTIFRRNHLIADLFSRIHFGEKIGSGMQRMKDICKAGSAPYPKAEYTGTHFYITFRQSTEYLKMAGKNEVVETAIEITPNERQKKFISALKGNAVLTRSDYEAITQASKRTALRDLRDLVMHGVIVGISTSKTDPNKRYKLA